MANAERQPGYYWVRVRKEGHWQVGEWDGESWAISYHGTLYDADFAEIDERRLERG